MSEFEIIKIQKGERFPYELPNSNIAVTFNNNGFSFVISFPGLTSEEIKAFTENDIKITLCKCNSKVAFFNINIDGFFFGEVAFNILETSYTEKDIRETNVFSFILVDEYGSITKGIRLLGVSDEFVLKIADVCKEQEIIGSDNYINEVLSVLNKYSSNDLVDMFSICEYKSESN